MQISLDKAEYLIQHGTRVREQGLIDPRLIREIMPAKHRDQEEA